MDDLTARKLAHNEALFREVNERISELREGWGAAESGFVCECADAACFETISVSNGDYQEVRRHDRRFIVVPGHELPELETVVERKPTYLVVEKQVPVPSVGE